MKVGLSWECLLGVSEVNIVTAFTVWYRTELDETVPTLGRQSWVCLSVGFFPPTPAQQAGGTLVHAPGSLSAVDQENKITARWRW
jgi:hypothetical protein